MRVKYNLWKNILLASMLMIAVSGTILMFVLPLRMEEKMLNDSEQAAYYYIKINAEKNIPEEAFLGKKELRFKWDRFVSENLTNGEIIGLRAYDAGGALIYQTGRNKPATGGKWKIVSAAGGKLTEVGKTKRVTSIYGNEEKVYAMQMIIPITNHQGTLGYLDVVQDINFIHQYLQNVRESIATIMLALLFILSLVLFEIGRKESKALLRENIKLENYDSQLSHTIRGQLATIKGFADVLYQDKSLSEKERDDYLGIVREEANQLNHQIDEVLNLTRLENGRIHLKKELVGIDNLIKESVDRVSKQAELKKIKLETKMKEIGVKVNVDKEKMIQAMGNLLIASVMRSMAGGKVSLEAKAGKDEIEFEIKDDGEEIPREDLPHIFNKFNWVENQQIQKVGSGLGLPLAKAVVEAHGGKINIENLKEKGAKFSVSLPAGK